jgi:hypothetical protein
VLELDTHLKLKDTQSVVIDLDYPQKSIEILIYFFYSDELGMSREYKAQDYLHTMAAAVSFQELPHLQKLCEQRKREMLHKESLAVDLLSVIRDFSYSLELFLLSFTSIHFGQSKDNSCL